MPKTDRRFMLLLPLKAFSIIIEDLEFHIVKRGRMAARIAFPIHHVYFHRPPQQAYIHEVVVVHGIVSFAEWCVNEQVLAEVRYQLSKVMFEHHLENLLNT